MPSKEGQKSRARSRLGIAGATPPLPRFASHLHRTLSPRPFAAIAARRLQRAPYFLGFCSSAIVDVRPDAELWVQSIWTVWEVRICIAKNYNIFAFNNKQLQKMPHNRKCTG